MAGFMIVVICIVAPYIIWNCQSLLSNYRKARQSGLPILICPLATNNVLWMVFSVICRPIFVRCLPSVVYEHIKPAIYGWEFLYKYEIFARLGPSFILVSPGRNEVNITDPEVAHAVLMRRNDFGQLDIGSRKLAAQM